MNPRILELLLDEDQTTLASPPTSDLRWLYALIAQRSAVQ